MTGIRLGRALFLVCLSLACAGTPDARAEDESCSEAELGRRKAKLRPRASEWWRTRKRLVFVCPQCKGQGKVRYRRRRVVDCPKCDGNRKVVDAKRYRKLFYDMRSPAFRSREGIQDRLTREYESARTGSPWPEEITKYHIDEVELVGERHGLVYVERNREDVAKPQRWVWAEDEKGRCHWCLWDEAADGPWARQSGSAAGEADDDPPLAAPPEIRRLVVEMLEASLTAFVPREVLIRGDTLWLRLLQRPGADPEEGTALIGSDGVALVRALFPVVTHASIRADWYLNWRDDLGRTEIRPRWTSTLGREKHDVAVWENLSESEQTQVLQWSTHTHDGWIPWAMPDPLPEGTLPLPVLPGARPRSEAAQESAWVDYLGYSFPPRKVHEHGVTLSASCSMTLDADAVLCTARFDAPVYQQPEPIRSRAGELEAAEAKLALFLPPSAAGKAVPRWVGIRLYVTHGSDVVVEEGVRGRATAWADGVHVGGGDLGALDRVSSDPHHEAFTLLWQADLAAALKMAKARGAIVRFGSEAGITITFGRRELEVLEDLLSRIVPE